MDSETGQCLCFLPLINKIYCSNYCVLFLHPVWQHPYVNIFKHVKLDEWRKASKEGDVTTYMVKKKNPLLYLHIFKKKKKESIILPCSPNLHPFFSLVTVGQDAQVHRLPNSRFSSSQQLHPDSQNQQSVSGPHGSLPVPALQTVSQ